MSSSIGSGFSSSSLTSLLSSSSSFSSSSSQDPAVKTISSVAKRSLKRKNLEEENRKKLIMMSSSSSFSSSLSSSGESRMSLSTSSSTTANKDEEDVDEDSLGDHERLLLESSNALEDFFSKFDDSDNETSTPPKKPTKSILRSSPPSSSTTSSSSSSSSSSPSPRLPPAKITFSRGTKLEGISQQPDSLENDATQSLSPHSVESELPPYEDQVTIKLGENRHYIGQVLKGMPHGLGREYAREPYKNENGDWTYHHKSLVYDGGWENGKYHVTKRIEKTESDGKKYQVYEQPGILYYPNSDSPCYIGGFVAGEKSGYGQSYSMDDKIKYDGEWEKDRYHGKGERTHRRGIYNGLWEGGKRQGSGIYYYFKSKTNLEISKIYEGLFQDNMKIGMGIWIDQERDVLIEVFYDAEEKGKVLKTSKYNSTTKRITSTEYQDRITSPTKYMDAHGRIITTG